MDAGGQAVVQRGRAVEVDFDVVLEGAVLAVVARTVLRIIAADFRTGGRPVEAAELKLDRIGRLGLRSHESG